MVTYLVPTTTAEHIARRMEGREGFDVVHTERNKEGNRRFPDDEVYTKISRHAELKDRTVVLPLRRQCI